MPDLDSIKNSISDGVSSLTSNPHLQQVGEYLKAHPTLSNSLLAGLAAGGVGAVATGLGGQRTGETPGGKRKRMLRNALGAALLGGGGAYALQEGMGRIAAPIPGDAPDAVSQGISNAGNKASDIIGSKPALAAAGLGGLAVANKGAIFGNTDRTTQAIKSILTPLPVDAAGSDVEKYRKLFDNSSSKQPAIAQLLKNFRSEFKGVDIDDIAKNGLNTVGHGDVTGAKELMHKLIDAHSIDGDRNSGAAAIKRLLGEAQADHGTGAMAYLKRHAQGLSQRTGLTDFKDALTPEGRMPGALGPVDSLRYGAQDKTRSLLQRLAGKFDTDGTARKLIERLTPEDSSTQRGASILNNEAGLMEKAMKHIETKVPGGRLMTPAQLRAAAVAHMAENSNAARATIASRGNLRNAVNASKTLLSKSRFARTGTGLAAGAGAAALLAKLLKSDPNQPPQ